MIDTGKLTLTISTDQAERIVEALELVIDLRYRLADIDWLHAPMSLKATGILTSQLMDARDCVKTGLATSTSERIPTGPLKEVLKKHTAQLERDLITRALNEAGGNITRTAENLAISRKNLQNKIKIFDLTIDYPYKTES